MKQYYTMRWCHREAIRLAWKCHHRFGVAQNEKEIAKVGEQLHKKRKPIITKVKNWYKKQKALILEKTGEEYIDANLDKCLEVEDLLQGIKDVECKFQVFNVFMKRNTFLNNLHQSCI